MGMGVIVTMRPFDRLRGRVETSNLERESMRIIGLMSGTSADGIDAAVVEISGAPPTLAWRLLAFVEHGYPPALRQRIFAAFDPVQSSVDQLCALNFALGHALANAALAAVEAANLAPEQIDLVGSHGQTVWHIADGPEASTLQIGEAAIIAERTGITTISNFRTRDMAAGGQGAPLVPLVDKLLLTHPTRTRAAQNLGGIGNVTFLPPAESSGGSDEAPFAFDTGPGNVLIDAALARLTEGAQAFDRDGALAAQGQPHGELVERWLADPYFQQPPPKTTGREYFGPAYEQRLAAQAAPLSRADYVATLTALTARSIAQAYRDFLPRPPDEVIVSGGGTRNPTLLHQLRAALHPAALRSSDEVGLDSAAKESIAFALLAHESWHGRPGNLPAATGASRPVVLGDITPGRRFWQ